MITSTKMLVAVPFCDSPYVNISRETLKCNENMPKFGQLEKISSTKNPYFLYIKRTLHFFQKLALSRRLEWLTFQMMLVKK